MDEQRFRHLADEAFRSLTDAFDDIDVDDADLEAAGNTLTVTYSDGSRCVVNTQAAACQIWLAGAGSGWHFSFDEDKGQWLHDKGTGDELFSVLARITRDACGLELQFS